MVNGLDIRQYHFSESGPLLAPSVGAEQLEAARFSGLDLELFMRLPGNRKWAELLGFQLSKSQVIAFYRTEKRLEAVKSDLEAKELKKKRGRRRA